jgi:homoserine kinase
MMMNDSQRARSSMHAVVQARVPATIANLGPGFDALGLAVGLWLEVSAQPAPEDQLEYEGSGQVPLGGDNLIHHGFRAAYSALGLHAPNVLIRAHNPIPLARGLGSSSAALVSGAALADAMMDGQLGRDGVLRVCAELEGHPDNVAPAVLGGFTASVMAANGPISVSLPVPHDWHVLVAVPEQELLTSEARGALPERYSREQAVYNLSRAALWVAGIASGRFDVLREACRDAIHQPYRAPLVPGLEDAIQGALQAGALAAFLSGAGPSVAAIVSGSVEPVWQAFQPYSRTILQLRPAGGYTVSVASDGVSESASDGALPSLLQGVGRSD